MKNSTALFIILSTISSCLMAQNSSYPKGEIYLNINDQFGQNNDWLSLSSTDKDLADRYFKRPASFTIGPDGNIFLVNNIKGEIELFNMQGDYIKSIATIKNRNQHSLERMAGILDNKYIVTENYDRIHIFNLDGSEFKTLKLDYPTFQVVPLADNVIAIYASVVYSGGRIKQSVILKNIITEKENQIESHIDESIKTIYSLEGDKSAYGVSYPYSHEVYILNRINKDQLLVGYTIDDILKVYSKEGKLLSKVNTNIKALNVPDSVKTEFKEKMKEHFTKIGYAEQFEKNPIQDSFIPSQMPFFHSIQVDDNNNILVFLYTAGKPTISASIYTAFSNNGQYLGTSSFNCANYNLRVDPKSRCIQFGDKQVHALVKDGDSHKSPFKLVKLTY